MGHNNNDSDSDDSDAVVKQESGDEDESGVTALQLSSCLAQARRLGAKVDELAQLRQLGSSRRVALSSSENSAPVEAR